MAKPAFHIKQLLPTQDWYWHLCAHNGRVVAVSSNGYSSKWKAIDGARAFYALVASFEECPIVAPPGKPGRPKKRRRQTTADMLMQVLE